MKYNKIFRLLAAAVIISLLAITLLVAPAMAQYVLLTPDTGMVGTTITITGYGIEVADGTYVYIFMNNQNLGSAQVTSGTFNTTAVVPDGAAQGKALVSVQPTSTYSTGGVLTFSYFTVITTQITATPATGKVGDQITVTGSDFIASSTISFYWDNVIVSGATTTATAVGSFSYSFTIPETTRGSHTLKAQDATAKVATTSVTVTQSISLNITSGGVGDQITVSGSSFRGSQPIAIRFGAEQRGTNTSNANGGFTASITVPAQGAGSYVVEASDGTYSATANFTIGAKASLNPARGQIDDEITVSGSGFGASQTVTITFNNQPVGNTSTNATGSFSGSFTVPSVPSHTYTVTVSDGINPPINLEFEVSISVIPSQDTGHVGSEITINGSGFQGSVSIKYDGVQLAQVPVSQGAFTATITIPTSIAGAHTITVSDNTNTEQLTFTMESTRPAVPQPLLPLNGGKTGGQAEFDWEDVSDDSGVTYTLQIASDAGFTTLVLEKTGITESGYTLTKEERLQSTGSDAPYYWRIRAVDGAGNTSQWTGAGTFVVGFQWANAWSVSGWLPWVVMSVGGLGLLVLGWWLGRRTAYV